MSSNPTSGFPEDGPIRDGDPGQEGANCDPHPGPSHRKSSMDSVRRIFRTVKRQVRAMSVDAGRPHSEGQGQGSRTVSEIGQGNDECQLDLEDHVDEAAATTSAMLADLLKDSKGHVSIKVNSIGSNYSQNLSDEGSEEEEIYGAITLEDIKVPMEDDDAKVEAEIWGPSGKVWVPFMKNAGDGRVSLHFQPAEEGQHLVIIMQGDEHVEGSPFEIFINRSNDDQGPSKSMALKEDKDNNNNIDDKQVPFNIVRGTSASFELVHVDNIPLLKAGAAVDVCITGPSGRQVAPFIKNRGDGRVSLVFQPEEEGPHQVNIKQDAENVEGSPYYAFVNPPWIKARDDPSLANNVLVQGPGLTHCIQGHPAEFTIRRVKGFTVTGVSLTVEGPGESEIGCHEDRHGVAHISFIAFIPGEYQIYVVVEGVVALGSPFTCKVTSEGVKRRTVSIGSTSDLPALAELPDDDAGLQAPSSLVAPSHGRSPFSPAHVRKDAKYLGISQGKVVSMNLSGGSHKKAKDVSPAGIGGKKDEAEDAKKVKVSGEGLSAGVTHQGNVIWIDLRDAGPGGLCASMEGPSKVDLTCLEEADGPKGLFVLTYWPKEPGFYSLSLKYCDKRVPGSPFRIGVTGEGSKLYEEVVVCKIDYHPPVQERVACYILCKLVDDSLPDILMLVPSIKFPGKEKFQRDCIRITDVGVGKGMFKIIFTPKSNGIHLIKLMNGSTVIPGFPLKFLVGPVPDAGGAHRVRVAGHGTQHGVQGRKLAVNVWGREAGLGEISVAIQGPSKAALEVEEEANASLFYTYSVSETGMYNLVVKFDDRHVPGSPFKVLISPSPGEAKKVRVVGLPKIPLMVGVSSLLLADLGGAKGELECKLVAPSKSEEDCFTEPIGADEHSIRVLPLEKGIHHLHVTLDGVHVPGSPFPMVVRSRRRADRDSIALNNMHLLGEAGKAVAFKTGTTSQAETADSFKVTCYGSGLEKARFGARNQFTVDCKGAGDGLLLVGARGTERPCQEVVVNHMGHNQFWVSYVPTESGLVHIFVLWGSKQVPGSPFQVEVV